MPLIVLILSSYVHHYTLRYTAEHTYLVNIYTFDINIIFILFTVTIFSNKSHFPVNKLGMGTASSEPQSWKNVCRLFHILA